jgi:hypothetical protein
MIGVSVGAAQQSPDPNLANVPRTSQLAPGHIARYQIPWYQSVSAAYLAPGASRSFAVVAVRNANPAGGPTCAISVTFRTLQGVDFCTVVLNIAPKSTGSFCTRPQQGVFPCANTSLNATCTSSGGITGILGGNAIVASANNPGCEKIQIDAAQYYTRDVNDTQVESVRTLRVMKAGSENEGD